MEIRLLIVFTVVFLAFGMVNIGFTTMGGVEEMSNIPNVTEEMLNADFWVSRLDDADRVIMTPDEINEYNSRIDESVDEVVDLQSFPNTIAGQALKEMIDEYRVPTAPRYDENGNLLGDDYYNALLSKRNLEGIKESNPAKFGLVVRRTNMRSFPTDDLVMNKPGDIEFDRFQETALYVGEPLAILHESSDGQWYFGQARFYRGWVRAKDVAIGERGQVLWFGTKEPFIVVTGNHIETGYNPYSKEVSEVTLDMGVRLPVEDNPPAVADGQATQGNFVVELPTRDANGNLIIKRAMIPRSEDVSIGYLPYTRGNIIRQAFKMQGERYDWGGKTGKRDCSALLMDIYSTFGFKLPRNTDEQESMYGIKYDLTNKSDAEREVIFAKLKPGAALYMPGHAMLYLGRVGARDYMIHDFSGYGDMKKRTPEGDYGFIPVMEVAVSGLDLPRTNGRTFMDALTTAVQIEE
ncbi:MAG: SH3 domain-containing protein [Thermoanaerobacteraceae bacterium]|nr:SH3 domain-containing protein [Thermoanaerobacteraceae bacterium]